MVFDLDVNSGSFGFFEDRSLDSLSSGERDEGVGSFSNDENVGRSGGKRVSNRVLKVNNGEASGVLFDLGDHSNSSKITSCSDGCQVSRFELDEFDDLSGGDVEFDSVVSLDQRIGESDGSGVAQVDEGDSVGSNSCFSNFAEFEFSFFGSDSVDGESSLGVVQESEGFVSGGDADNVLESSGVSGVGSDLSVDLNVSGQDDLLGFSSSKGVLKSVSQENGEGKAFSQFVGSLRRSGSKNSSQLCKHPVLGCI